MPPIQVDGEWGAILVGFLVLLRVGVSLWQKRNGTRPAIRKDVEALGGRVSNVEKRQDKLHTAFRKLADGQSAIMEHLTNGHTSAKPEPMAESLDAESTGRHLVVDGDGT
jgi:hypothetical protein